jgi:MYXO-CTERM domain-containing protein
VRSLTLSGLGFVLCFAPGAAYAATCGKPDLRAAFPPDDASDVPTNAVLIAYYAATAVYQDEPVTLTREGDADGTEVAASYDLQESALRFVPDGGLDPGTFTIAWPALHGTGTASIGLGKRVTFTVVDRTDDGAPEFGGLRSIDWDVKRYEDDCTDSTEERFDFDLGVGAASDDSDANDLALLVFQTKGRSIGKDGASKPVLVSAFPGRDARVRVEQSLGEGRGDVCFAALARDLAGHTSSGGDREVCTHTIDPPFFYGCAVASKPARGGLGFAALAAVTLSLLVRRRHRRRS